MRPSHAAGEQGTRSVGHNVHDKSVEQGRTLGHMGVVQKAAVGGGLQTPKNPSLLFGAQNVQKWHGIALAQTHIASTVTARHCKSQFSVEHLGKDGAMPPAEVAETPRTV